jgi:hypothetical protein
MTAGIARRRVTAPTASLVSPIREEVALSHRIDGLSEIIKRLRKRSDKFGASRGRAGCGPPMTDTAEPRPE